MSKMRVIARARISTVLIDCLSVPKIMGIGPIRIIPAPFVFCSVVWVFRRLSKSTARKIITAPMMVRLIPMT